MEEYNSLQAKMKDGESVSQIGRQKYEIEKKQKIIQLRKSSQMAIIPHLPIWNLLLTRIFNISENE